MQSISSQKSLDVSSGPLLQSVGSVSSREIFTTLKSEVARSFSGSILNSSCIAEPLRCDPNRGQRRVRQAAVHPRCDRTCGQRGEQCSSFSSSNGSSLAGAGRSSGPTIPCSSSTGSLASSRSGAPGSVGVARVVAARWLRAGAAREEDGRSLLVMDRSSTPVSVHDARADPLRWLRSGAVRKEDGKSSLVSNSGSVLGRVEGGRVEAARRTRAGAARGKAADLALNRQAARKRVDLSGSATDFDSAFIPHARSFSLHPSLVSNNSCGAHGVGGTNSCGSMHGVVMHDNSSGLHVNSCGALGHKNSCHVHAAEVRRGTKALSMSTRLGVRCPAVEKLASPQQAPGSLHGEVWASILQNQGPKIFREVEIIPGCAVTVACPSCPDHSPEPPGPGRIIRNMLGWSLEEKNVVGSGVWLFRGALQGKNLFSSLDVTGDWVRKGSYHTAWAVPCDSFVWAGPRYRATHWTAMLAIA